MAENNDKVFNRSAKSYHNLSDISYDDDGFFSDVPISGYRSKSLIALNKYVKTNLLYESDTDDKSDSVYFSKESSPKDSVSKCDTESIQSVGSNETKQIHAQQIIEFIPKELQIVYDIAHVVCDSVSNDISQDTQNYNKPILRNGVDSTPKKVRSAIIELNDKRRSVQFKEPFKNVTEDEQTIPKEIDHVKSLDKQCIQEDKKLVKNIHRSLDDLAIKNKVEIVEKQRIPPEVKPRNPPEVKLRTKFNNVPPENRHTFADFTAWKNRTDIYPDVYAPLPYSKLTNHNDYINR